MLGSIGHMGCYSFHETKNVICGEGKLSALTILNSSRARDHSRQGNQSQAVFPRPSRQVHLGQSGSSYVPSEIACAFLYGQLENSTKSPRAVQADFRPLYDLAPTIGKVVRVFVAANSQRLSGQIPPLLFALRPTKTTCNNLMAELQKASISAVFHYVPLHTAPYAKTLGLSQLSLPITEEYSGDSRDCRCITDLSADDQARVAEGVQNFFQPRSLRIAA